MDSVIGSSAFKTLKLEDAIFSKLRIDYKPPSSITHLVVSNSHLVLALINRFLIKINLSQLEDKEEVDLTQFIGATKIHKVFIDPTGQHIIISLVNKDNSTPADALYLSWKNTKPKVCTKLKGFLVTAVGWNVYNHTDGFTGPILIGTSKGLILEIDLASDERPFQGGFERGFKQLHSFEKDDKNNMVSNIEIHKSPLNDLLYLVICSLPLNVVQFFGSIRSVEDRPFFENIFRNCSTLCTFSINRAQWNSTYFGSYCTDKVVKTVVALSYHDLHIGEIAWTQTSASFSNSKNYSFSDICDEVIKPCGIVITQFHILLAWPHKIVGICTLNAQNVFEDNIPDEYGSVIGISKDIFKGSIWVYTEKTIFKYKVDKESKNIWQIYLDKGNYELSKKFCDKDETALFFILQKEAEDLFQKGEVVKSANIYAKIPLSFEEICLKFVEADADEGLKVFLKEKLCSTKANEKTQIALIVMWLMELYLKKLGELRDDEKRNGPEYQALDKEFKNFLRDPKTRLFIDQNPTAVYNLLASHDDQDNYVGVAIIMKDFSRVVSHLIEHKRYIEALEVMSTQSNAKLFYQHTPSLLQFIPKETIASLIDQGPRLDPLVILPTLVHAHASYGHSFEVLRYLEFCIDKLDIHEKVLHNFLITLYCSLFPEKLLTYLKLQGEDSSSVCFDIKFALRECVSAGLDAASIHLLTIMGLYQEAIELALKSDLTIAKAIANRTKYDTDLCKKLWLMIASHVVQHEKDISCAMEVLKECSLLKIEDILPFFPDFATIDQFKDAICNSLQEYNEKIDNLKKEMEESAVSADHIRADIKKFKQKCSVVKVQDKCSECKFPLFSNSFYIFPCSHKFHEDCLSDAVMPFLSESMQKRFSDCKGKLISLSNDEMDRSKAKETNLWNEREKIRQKIDAIVASECLYCGDFAVNNIDTPFIQDNEWESVLTEWL